MKQVIVIILAVVLFLGVVVLAPKYGDEKTFGELKYYVQPDGTVKIFEYTGSKNKVTIPYEIDGKKVSSIAKMSIGYKEENGEKVKIENFLINGYSGTASQEYADEGDFLFNCLHKFQSQTIRKSTYGTKGSERFSCACGFVKTEKKDFLKIPNLPLKSAKPDGDGVKLKWQEIKGIEKYNIYRSVDNGEFEFLSSSVDTEYIDYQASTGFLKYYITGAAGKNEGKQKVKPLSLDYVKSPYLKLNSTKRGVKLNWQTTENTKLYRVYKRLSDTDYKLLFETVSQLEYVDKAVKKHSQYFYTVVSVDNAGKESSKSEVGKPIIYGEKAKVVYLTFDDGPSENTLRILEILKKYNAKATFFVTSLDTPKYMKNIVDEGHSIALHTYSHDYEKIYSSDKNYFEDLNKIGNLVKEQTGVETKVIRFPGGSSNTISAEYSEGIMTRLAKAVEKKGYRYFDWNVDSGDAAAKYVAATKILNNVKSRSKGKKRCVVLMHDTLAKSSTVAALDSICAYYKSNGYEFDVLTTNSVSCHQTINN